MSYNKGNSIIYSAVITVVAMIAILTGCTDDIFPVPEDIPDVDVEVCGEVIFKPLVPTEVKTRTDAPDGAKYNGIKSLYVLFFDSEKKIAYRGEVEFTGNSADGGTHERVTFKKKVRAGRYYVYAAVNIPADRICDLDTISTISGLRNFKIYWQDNIEDDLEMFGVFRQSSSGSTSIPDNERFEDDALITILPTKSSIHSWVRRAVSKVTVDFDGKNLKDGVTVYIKDAKLVDVPDASFLGKGSHVDGKDITCVPSSYSIVYGIGGAYSGWPTVTNNKSFAPPEVWTDCSAASFHDDAAKALPCYENLQGEPEGRSKLQDSDGDGVIDSFHKDSVLLGTYLEVEGYYVADRPEYKSRGKIIYRFMLGKDAVKNFDVVRNHHYKITMRFKGYGNDVDWHIVYEEKYLDASFPRDVNYKGEYLLPDNHYNTALNGGHEFDNKNVITVTSYSTDGKTNTWIDPEISYTYYAFNDKDSIWEPDNGTSAWLKLIGEPSGNSSQKKYTFVASMTNPVTTTVEGLFPSKGKGTETSPYNLSNKNGGSTVENTANCYMVDASGWYSIPLVYGNAITGKVTRSESYSSPHIVNHLDLPITAPYIKDNKSIKDSVNWSKVSVKLIWQDAQKLIDTDNLFYDPGLFGGKGGIKFYIPNIKEGNAVIALIDGGAREDAGVYLDRGTVYGKSGSTRAIWSWHIWATRFGSTDFEKTVNVVNRDGRNYEVMPVNLGWCSDGKSIRIYKRRKCEIRFKVDDKEIVRTIEQYPHIAVPRGDHPYYQWGRKDPFVGSNTPFGNKPRWNGAGTEYKTGSEYNPPRLYIEPGEFQHNIGRKTTQECIHVLIKNPDKWHNAPREPINPLNYKDGFYSTNKSYDDLWVYKGYKTVYDPCPPGFQIGDPDVFSGFIIGKGKIERGEYWYDVLETDMLQDFYDSGLSVNGQVLELYTDTRKIQSVVFPVTGYRDYDDKGAVVKYPRGHKDYWNGEGFVWLNKAGDATNSYHLKFIRDDLSAGGDWKSRGTIISPEEKFYNCNGYGIRPVKISNYGIKKTR